MDTTEVIPVKCYVTLEHWSGMDYLPGPGAHELRGPLNQSLCVKSLGWSDVLFYPEKTLLRGRGRGHLHGKTSSRGRGVVGMLYTAPPLPPRRSVLLFTNSNLRKGEGAFYMSRPRGPWFHNPSMTLMCALHVCLCMNKVVLGAEGFNRNKDVV